MTYYFRRLWDLTSYGSVTGFLRDVDLSLFDPRRIFYYLRGVGTERDTVIYWQSGIEAEGGFTKSIVGFTTLIGLGLSSLFVVYKYLTKTDQKEKKPEKTEAEEVVPTEQQEEKPGVIDHPDYSPSPSLLELPKTEEVIDPDSSTSSSETRSEQSEETPEQKTDLNFSLLEFLAIPREENSDSEDNSDTETTLTDDKSDSVITLFDPKVVGYTSITPEIRSDQGGDPVDDHRVNLYIQLVEDSKHEKGGPLLTKVFVKDGRAVMIHQCNDPELYAKEKVLYEESLDPMRYLSRYHRDKVIDPHLDNTLAYDLREKITGQVHSSVFPKRVAIEKITVEPGESERHTLRPDQDYVDKVFVYQASDYRENSGETLKRALKLTVALGYLILERGLSLKPESLDYSQLLADVGGTEWRHGSSGFANHLKECIDGKFEHTELIVYMNDLYKRKDFASLIETCAGIQTKLWDSVWDTYTPTHGKAEGLKLIKTVSCFLETHRLFLDKVATETVLFTPEDSTNRTFNMRYLFESPESFEEIVRRTLTNEKTYNCSWITSETIQVFSLSKDAPANDTRILLETDKSNRKYNGYITPNNRLTIHEYNKGLLNLNAEEIKITGLGRYYTPLTGYYEAQIEQNSDNNGANVLIKLMWDQYLLHTFVRESVSTSVLDPLEREILSGLTASTTWQFYGVTEMWRQWYYKNFTKRHADNVKKRGEDWKSWITKIIVAQRILSEKENLDEWDLKFMELMRLIKFRIGLENTALRLSREDLTQFINDTKVASEIKSWHMDPEVEKLIGSLDQQESKFSFRDKQKWTLMANEFVLGTLELINKPIAFFGFFFHHMSIESCWHIIDESEYPTPLLLMEGFELAKFFHTYDLDQIWRDSSPQGINDSTAEATLKRIFEESHEYRFSNDYLCEELPGDISRTWRSAKWQIGDNEVTPNDTNLTEYVPTNKYGMFGRTLYSGKWHDLLRKLEERVDDPRVEWDREILVKSLAFSYFKHGLTAQASFVSGKGWDYGTHVNPGLHDWLARGRVFPDPFEVSSRYNDRVEFETEMREWEWNETSRRVINSQRKLADFDHAHSIINRHVVNNISVYQPLEFPRLDYKEELHQPAGFVDQQAAQQFLEVEHVDVHGSTYDL